MSTQEEAETLDDLSHRFLEALDLHRAGRLDAAEDALRQILKEEPRLAEPRLSLARILLDTGRLDVAEEHTREALKVLESDGHWTDDVPPHVLQALANAQLAEVIRQQADEDDVIFGDPDRYHAMLEESRKHFSRAAELDPSDDTSSYFAFFLGPPQAPQ